MPTIEISAGLAAGLPARMLRFTNEQAGYGIYAPNAAPNYYGLFSAASSWTAGRTRIYSGAFPSAPLNLSFSYLNSASNFLVSFGTQAGDFTDGVTTDNPAVIRTPAYRLATASGTATHFVTYVLNTYSAAGQNVHHQFAGTVGLPGSGADLEISDVNIISGQPYRIEALRIAFPTAWTYGD
jgi:hypothetical protein